MRVLIVCLGNICRSPVGEGLLRHHASEQHFPLIVDSAGTSGWHQGALPDERSMEVMRQHGHDISDQRARPLVHDDLHLYDIILAMDSKNLNDIESMGTRSAQAALFVPGENVPDPYYGGHDGFQRVYDMIDVAAKNWITLWKEEENQ
jgi:protein-tyrosine phosphatase